MKDAAREDTMNAMRKEAMVINKAEENMVVRFPIQFRFVEYT